VKHLDSNNTILMLSDSKYRYLVDVQVPTLSLLNVIYKHQNHHFYKTQEHYQKG